MKEYGNLKLDQRREMWFVGSMTYGAGRPAGLYGPVTAGRRAGENPAGASSFSSPPPRPSLCSAAIILYTDGKRWPGRLNPGVVGNGLPPRHTWEIRK